jgi:hypothetical protein
MAVLVQPLDLTLPLHPARRHAAPLSHRHPHLHVRHARPDAKTLGMGLARRAVHPVEGGRKEDAPAFAGACLPCGRSTIVHVFSRVQFGDRWWYRHAPAAGWVLGANPVRGSASFLASTARGTLRRSSSAAGRVRSLRAAVSIANRDTRLCVPVRRRAAHVRV